MRWNEIQEEFCSVARTMSVIGDRWTMLILRDCFLGTHRFDDFQKQLRVTRHLLADRLRKLVAHGVLIKVPYQEKPTRYEYRLTQKGIDLYPIIMGLVQWGDKYMASDTQDVPMEYIHTSCGQKTEATLICSQCQEAIEPKQMRPIATPALVTYIDAHPELKATAAYKFVMKDS